MKALIACVAIVALLPAAAPAQGKDKQEKECAPVPEEFLSAGEVFRDCAVDKKARVTRVPRLDFSSLATTGGAGCMTAEVDLVVDEQGAVVPGSARLVSTNDQRYARELMAAIYQTRYSPAKKGDVPVKQLHRFEGKAQYRVVSSASPGSSSRRPPPC